MRFTMYIHCEKLCIKSISRNQVAYAFSSTKFRHLASYCKCLHCSDLDLDNCLEKKQN